MKNKITLLFAALMMTLGVSAQQTLPEGYFPFTTEYLEMVEITDPAELTAGKLIAIQHNHGFGEHDHDGYFFSIDSKVESGVHKMAMHEKCTGLSAFTLVATGEDGCFNLKTVHEGNWVGELSSTQNYTKTSSTAAKYRFTLQSGFGFTVDCVDSEKRLYVNTSGSTISLAGADITNAIDDKSKDHVIFKIYELKQPFGVTTYVENAKVILTGQGGNTIEGTHTGWSDFYEFVLGSNAHGCTLSNVYYDANKNLITGNIKFPFAVTGNYVQVPTYLHAGANNNNRVSIVDGTLKVVENEEGDEHLNSQWYIIPKIEGLNISYALYNVEAKQYIYNSGAVGDKTITLNKDEGTYFTLVKGTSENQVRFAYQYKYQSGNNVVSTSYYLGYDGNKNIISSSYGNNWNFLVSSLSSESTDLGFVQKYPVGTAFWNAGKVETYPDAIKNLIADARHDLYNEGTHEVYSAQTEIKVNQRSNVTVTFTYNTGGHLLNIFGVDIINEEGINVLNDYHQGKAGEKNENNVYTLENVAPGVYTLRYFVCNTSDLTTDKGHWLGKNAGTITVEGANRYLKISDAPQGSSWADNTTWYTLNQGEGLDNVISAQPAYTDFNNYLRLANNTRPADAAGLWSLVGNETDGYLIYNRAWGPEYALHTEGNEAGARTYMKEVANATRYDVVLHEFDNTGKGQWFIRRHGSTNHFLNDRGDYLATWNTDEAYAATGSIMTFTEVITGLDELDENLVSVQDELENSWLPWIGCETINNVYKTNLTNSTFASWVLGRQQLAALLDGKVFKFANKATGDRSGRVLGIDANGIMLGMEPSQQEGGNINEFVQLNHNGDGTYNLLHLATNKYLALPEDNNTAVADVNSAAKYSIANYAEDPTAALFAVSNTHLMNLGDDTRNYKLTNYNGHPEDAASRWTVTFDADAQALAELIEEAKARYAETQEAAYQANVGVPGYANAESTGALNTTINGGLTGKTFADATTALTEAMEGVTAAEKAVFFPTDCYFTITNRTHSLVYAVDSRIDETHNAEFIWTTEEVDATNPNHLWGFYRDVETGDYYLYNVGKVQFANSKGKGSYGDTWILSNNPVAITMEAMDAPYFHIKGDGKTMSVSTGYVGPVITYYENGDQGVPMQFNKSTVTVKKELLEQLKNLGTVEFASGFYTLKYNNLYLNDTRLGGAGTAGDGRRTLTAMTDDKIDNIFYYTPDNEMVGYKSGYGFTYGYCNTGKPETGYNTFTFETSSEPGKYLIHSATGGSTLGWGDRYLIVDGENQFTATNDWNKKFAAAWTIEAVTELPVKLNQADDGFAYATLYTPVALTINDAVEAYTGVVSADGNYLQLSKPLSGVIPAGTAVVLKTKNEVEKGDIYNFAITTSDATADANNVLKGDIFTTSRGGATYYSLNNADGIGFYNYEGTNLTGFRARISGEDADVTKLTFRFGNPTGIEGITSAPQNEVVYDLSGRRVATPKKGLYIVNGKKVFIK